MIYDFEYLATGDFPKLIIIGSGPAGITLSKKLADKGVASLILEAGGLDWTEKAQETCKGEVIGDKYWDLEYSRLKYFGGTSNHWSGRCRHLEEEDFQKRSDIEGYIGWPINKGTLLPFMAETNQILELPTLRERNIDPYLKEVEFGISPVRFGQKYLNFFKNSKLANVCLNSYVLSTGAMNGRINNITVTGPDGSSINIKPENVVFCLGGIDNSRILLWSNETSLEPVVKNTEALGKYWFEHPHNMSGETVEYERHDIYSPQHSGVAFFSLTSKAMHEFGILNACLRLRRRYTPYSGPIRTAYTTFCRSKLFNDLSGYLKDGCTLATEVVWEQEPRAQNKVELSTNERDGYGVPRPILHWEKSKLDYRTAKVMMELYGRYLAVYGFGAVKSFDHVIEAVYHPPSAYMAGHHHMGGTRMAENSKLGVVDRNSKIFGLDNGFILGSSVFPTGGHANPTYTIVQLALRLGEHLATALTNQR